MDNKDNVENNDLVVSGSQPLIDLQNLINGLIVQRQEKEHPKKRLKYVMYIRKSSKDEDHQIRSIHDQLVDCRKLRKDLKLRVSKVIVERCSAKESGLRLKFTQMLKDIKEGKYDGIVAWHPDRLARNMMEAGMIIDMLDRDEIKDLKFCSLGFQNNSSGKMLLGMSFVMSKEYTDHLSDSINRGNRRSVADGSGMGVSKHGYYRDKNYFYRRDGANYALICEAWKRKLKGDTLEDIADFLNKSHYEKSTKVGGIEHHRWNMDDNKLSIMFRDSFFTGILKIGDYTVNLAEKYSFEPVVSVKDYLKINKIDDIKNSFVTKKGLRRADVKAHFLREFVICSDCGKVMNPVVTVKHDKKTGEVIKRYVNFRCRTVNCKREKKSVRANKVYTYILDFLKKNIKISEPFYKNYLKELDVVKNQKKKLLRSEKMSLIQENVGIAKKITRYKLSIVNEDDEDLKIEFKKDLKGYKKTHEENLNRINKIELALKLTDQAPISYSEFVELFKKMPYVLEKVRKESLKSEIIKKMFANCTLKGEKVVSLQYNEPYIRFMPTKYLAMSGE